MKRGLLGPSSPWTAKRRRSTDVQAYVDTVGRVQQELNGLDGACAAEQLRIQRKFDLEKEPLLKARAEAISSIPHFWRATLLNHPDVFKAEVDAEVLGFLDELAVVDNEDDFGSHTIRLVFSEGNPFFSEKELVKKIKILQDNSELITNPEISWAPGKKPKTKSFFDYFSADVSLDNDLGDVLRRDLWINPYVYFLSLAPDVLDKEEEDEQIQEQYQDL